MTMGFLKRFFMNVLHDRQPDRGETGVSSFDSLTEEELEAHLSVAEYAGFRLSEAVRPSYDLQVTPRQGYRHDSYRDQSMRDSVPVLMASASLESLFDLFMDTLEPLGNDVDVVVETSHHQRRGRHQDLHRESIDLPVLKSILWDFEDLLVNDGCTGIAVLNPAIPQEVQFDEHKLLIIYGEPLAPFEDILRTHGIPCRDDLRFITEAEHVHSSTEEFCRNFEILRTRLGIDDPRD
jgi:hypothetical protein